MQLDSDNLFDYCEYYKYNGTVYETSILCNIKGIEWIEPWTFNWYGNVTNLTIMWNNIEMLESNTFLWLDNLESLSISDNQIRNIEVWAFNWLPKLKQLDISHNQISTLENWLFNWLSLLEELSLRLNKISNLERGIFSWLSNLISLNLSENLIGTIKDWAFLWLWSLVQLMLNNNSIEEIEDESFSNLSNLETLYINFNGINEVKYWTFKWLMNVKYINLWYNNISILKSWVFFWLNNLENINLTNNRIISFDDNVFYNLSDLTNLDLSDNCLDYNDTSRIKQIYSNVDISLVNFESRQGVCFYVNFFPNKEMWIVTWPVSAALSLTWNESIISNYSSYIESTPNLIFTKNGTKTFNVVNSNIPSIRNFPMNPHDLWDNYWVLFVYVDWIDANSNNLNNDINSWNNTVTPWSNNINSWSNTSTQNSTDDTWINVMTNNFFTFDYSKFNPNYSDEMNRAYQYAYYFNITTKDSIDKANMNWWLTRIAMAKMLSNYAISVLWKEPDSSKVCSFSDITLDLDAQYDNWVTKACQLDLMWVWISKFRPHDSVTRAEFATALSRLLYWTKDWIDNYYSTHITTLYNKWIIFNTNPKLLEKRWYVMLMLMRAADKN